MIKIDIPNYSSFKLEHLVLDYNGTLAVDGYVEQDIISLLNDISSKVKVHIITADTFSRARDGLKGVDCQLTILNSGCQKQAKLDFIQQLGCNHVISGGNGRNDCLMLKHSALGIAVILSEGLAIETMLAADVICKDILSTLQLLINPMRLIATLRG